MLTFWPVTSVVTEAEQALGRDAERLDEPLPVDHDQCVRHRVKDRAEQCFAML